jgi:arsenate reductase (glutaredoxin)
LILYGISTCDTCKKALKALAAAGHTPEFRDIRAQPLTAGEIDQIVAEFGSRAINTQSTTYRSFSDFLKASEPEAQIAAQPTVMKRPVIQINGTWYLGWAEDVQTALIG